MNEAIINQLLLENNILRLTNIIFKHPQIVSHCSRAMVQKPLCCRRESSGNVCMSTNYPECLTMKSIKLFFVKNQVLVI